MEGLVSTLADAERKLRKLERDAEEMQSQEFRALAQEYINDMREVLKTLRRFEN
jgi:signal transduction histidine kinase